MLSFLPTRNHIRKCKIVMNDNAEAGVSVIPLLANPTVLLGKKSDIETEGRGDQAEEGGLFSVSKNRRNPPASRHARAQQEVDSGFAPVVVFDPYFCSASGVIAAGDTNG